MDTRPPPVTKQGEVSSSEADAGSEVLSPAIPGLCQPLPARVVFCRRIPARTLRAGAKPGMGRLRPAFPLALRIGQLRTSP